MSARKVNGFSLEISDVEPEEISDLLDLYKGYINEFIRVGPKGYLIPKEYKKHVSSVYNMPLRSTDVIVASFQRSGTTWTQELIWLVQNNLDYNTAASKYLTERYAFLDTLMLINEKAAKKLFEGYIDNRKNAEGFVQKLSVKPLEVIATATGPRFVKTHLPFSLLPPSLIDTAKVVYVARDPRDVVVSLFYHARALTIMGYTGDFKQFWDLFIKDKFILTPYFEHIKEAWALRHHSNTLIIFYEELSADLPGTVRRVCRFFGKEYTDEQISELCDHLTFEKFQNNKSVNAEHMSEFNMLTNSEKFIRKGKVGGWRNYFDPDMSKQAEQWIRDNLRDTDIQFPSFQDIDFT